MLVSQQEGSVCIAVPQQRRPAKCVLQQQQQQQQNQTARDFTAAAQLRKHHTKHVCMVQLPMGRVCLHQTDHQASTAECAVQTAACVGPFPGGQRTSLWVGETTVKSRMAVANNMWRTCAIYATCITCVMVSRHERQCHYSATRCIPQVLQRLVGVV